MVLLIQGKDYASTSWNIFTFHYGSTYTITPISSLPVIYIYIPLWFYLYSRRSRLAFLSYFNLHSTMVLLIRNGDTTDFSFRTFTFHYGSTYTVIRLYRLPPVSHLHSTMVLLIPLPHLHGWYPFNIYIPLWFYLYDQESVFNRLTNKFTFHYGSTYTSAWYADGLRYRKFTFHYGSTYTRFFRSLASFAVNLHSTMVLLILPRLHAIIRFEKYLHSTMVLLILVWHK